MEKIEKKINGFIGMTISATVIMILLGITFFIIPGTIINILRWLAVAIMVASGFGAIVRGVSRDSSLEIISGIGFFLIGVLVAMHPETVNIVMIILGAYMIITSISSLFLTKNIRSGSIYVLSVIYSLIGLIGGIIMFVHPGESTEVAMQIAGVVLMIYGISGLIDAITIKVRIDEVKDSFKQAKKTVKSLVDDAEEAEVVEKKSKKNK